MTHLDETGPGLKAIVAYKLIKAFGQALATAVLIHEAVLGRLDTLAARLAGWFGRQDLLRSLAGEVSHLIRDDFDHRNMVAGIALLGLDACLTATEGLGLHYRQRWAAWLVVVASSLLVPVELWGIWHKPTPFRFLILAVNLSIVAYLALKVLHHHRTLDAARENPPGASPLGRRIADGSR